jgi:hypothetical protein
MSEEEIPLSKHDQLAMAIALGKSISQWARENEVPTRTAYRWASEPDVRRQVNDCRRRSLDRVLGWMAGRSLRAVKTLTKLSETAKSESVQLSAARAVLSDQIAVAKHANLEFRLAEMEERVNARIRNSNGQS